LESEFDLFGRIDATGKGAVAGVLATGDNERADGADEFGCNLRRTRAGGQHQSRSAAKGKTTD
jgi:hypothetical protein